MEQDALMLAGLVAIGSIIVAVAACLRLPPPPEAPTVNVYLQYTPFDEDDEDDDEDPGDCNFRAKWDNYRNN